MTVSGTTEIVPVEDFVNAYESVRAREPVSIRDFLPARDDPRFLSALAELVRVEMEYGWNDGSPRRLTDYRADYPELFADRAVLAGVAFEAFRLRRQAGEAVTREEYALQLGVDTSNWPEEPGSVQELSNRLAAAEVHFPEPGATVAGFRLERELGRGAFGRVFLARQGDLADRPVALKVAADVGAESRALARLQHTNVMPVYSVHRVGPFQAVCMPYFPAVTLADLCHSLSKRGTLPESGQALLDTLRARTAIAGQQLGSDLSAPEPAAPPVKANLELLGGVSFVKAVVWLGARLADGLAHAHERGIVHRDLKPANLLLTDEGQPLILDFNLAADLNPTAEQARAALGGTLPYMPSEQLQAFRDRKPYRDPRGDVYALGLILFELLAGRHPFPIRRGSPERLLSEMIADRQSPPGARTLNAAVPRGVEAVLCKCLEPDPDRRYPTGRELQEDLQRQFDDQPLKHAREPFAERVGKWRRAHPRLMWRSVGIAAAVVAVAAGIGLVNHSRRNQRLEKQAQAALFHADYEDTHFRAAFAPLPVGTIGPDDPDLMSQFAVRWPAMFGPDFGGGGWERALDPDDWTRLRREVGDSYYLMAEEKAHPRGRRSDAAQMQEALALNERARAAYPPGEVPRGIWIQRAELLRRLGEDVTAAETEAERAEVKSAHDAFWTAREYIQKGRRAVAAGLLRQAAVQDPADPLIQAYLGWLCEKSRRPAKAAEHFGLAIGLYFRRAAEAATSGKPLPFPVDTYSARGLSYVSARQYGAAEGDFTEVIRHKVDYLDAYVNRALARELRGDLKGALADLDHALERVPGWTDALFQRARVRRLLDDHAGAAADHAAGLRSTPKTPRGWTSRGFALAGLPAPGGWLGREVGLIRARAALADLEEALRLDPDFADAVQNKAHLLSERLGRPDQALATLDRFLANYPEQIGHRAGRAVLLARAGKDQAAAADAEAVVAAADPLHDAFALYQVAGAYALMSERDPGHRQTALDLLARAMRMNPALVEITDIDPELKPLAGDIQFEQLKRAAAVLARPEK